MADAENLVERAKKIEKTYWDGGHSLESRAFAEIVEQVAGETGDTLGGGVARPETIVEAHTRLLALRERKGH